MASQPSFSIVINTDGRARSLAVTLESLRYLDYPHFEVCVVRGPTEDGTSELLARWPDRIKVAACPERNLSVSRNIGIAMAAGEIVAFIDDDAVPEAEWLSDLAPAFEDPLVGGAGGIVYDHTGAAVQYQFVSVNRLGRADYSAKEPADGYNFPFSDSVPNLQGTNAAFRKSVLLELGGFDEEYEYYLDETDLCCRIIDAGYLLRQVRRAIVHHKYLPSAIRDRDRQVRNCFPLLKNKIYFSLKNNHEHHSYDEVLRDAMEFIADHERNIRSQVKQGRFPLQDLSTFFDHVERAWQLGLARGMRDERRLMRTETLAANRMDFLELSRAKEESRRVFCIVSREFPPGKSGGISRYLDQLSRSIAAAGHHIHVLTEGTSHNQIDFDRGVWVHRILPREQAMPRAAQLLNTPKHIWNFSATMLDELKSIARKRRVDCVYAPIWDCGGLAVLLDETFPLVTSLQTSMHFWLANQPSGKLKSTFINDFAQPMLGVERVLLERSDAVHAISQSIATEISSAYNVAFSPSRLTVIPLGLEDWRDLPYKPAPPVADSVVRLLFVGRLEDRKGIDVLLAAMAQLMPRHPELYLDVVGNDTLLGPNGRTYREAFESHPDTRALRSRVRFHGEVDEKALRGFYRACDLFIAPSRFESFGLVFLEAMMFAKPVVGCRVNGMVEVIEDGTSGLLAEPGDVASLSHCIERLATDAAMRARLGYAGRIRYEHEFRPERMATAVVQLMNRAALTHARIQPGAEALAIRP